MSLYTKYRPKTFEDVASQDDAVTYLKNIIEKNKNLKPGEKIPHAYLFAGGHGIGKTTLARIFARELGTDEADIYELDAASSSKKIDDMREIIESVYTMPILSKYKVYIFDEAHMLTRDSSNAFLKTLEEPPAHVIFILCTTDPNKLISTVRSRCNIVNLKKPSVLEIKTRLVFILGQESISLNKNQEINSEILNYVSVHSNQSFRDSITNLEKVLHTFSEKIKDQSLEVRDIENMFGKRSIDIYKDIFQILAQKSSEKNEEIKDLKEKSKKEETIEKVLNFCKDNYYDFSYVRMLECFRNAMLIKNKIEIEDGDECSQKDYINFVTLNAAFFTSASLLYFLEKSELYENINDKESVLIAILGNFVEIN